MSLVADGRGVNRRLRLNVLYRGGKYRIKTITDKCKILSIPTSAGTPSANNPLSSRPQNQASASTSYLSCISIPSLIILSHCISSHTAESYSPLLCITPHPQNAKRIAAQKETRWAVNFRFYVSHYSDSEADFPLILCFSYTLPKPPQPPNHCSSCPLHPLSKPLSPLPLLSSPPLCALTPATFPLYELPLICSTPKREPSDKIAD